MIEALAARLVWSHHRHFGRPDTIISVDKGMSVMESDPPPPVGFAKCVGMIVSVLLYVSFSDSLWCQRIALVAGYNLIIVCLICHRLVLTVHI
jgi:hypothetical protein